MWVGCGMNYGKEVPITFIILLRLHGKEPYKFSKDVIMWESIYYGEGRMDPFHHLEHSFYTMRTIMQYTHALLIL